MFPLLLLNVSIFQLEQLLQTVFNQSAGETLWIYGESIEVGGDEGL